MALFKRLSDGLWSLISPTKTSTTKNTPETVPKSKKHAQPLISETMNDALRDSRSMSPEERINNWRLGSSNFVDSDMDGSKKRKRRTTTTTASRGPGRPRKVIKMEEMEMDEEYSMGYTMAEIRDGDYSDSNEEGEEESESESHNYADDGAREDNNSTSGSNINVGRGRSVSRSPTRAYSYDSPELDSSLVVAEAEYERHTPKRKYLVSPTKEHFSRGVSTEDLRAQGWDDDHIHLVQKIAMRGYEPLMPHYWRFEYRFHMPDSLFDETDSGDTHINSVRGDHFRATMALDRLLELGGRVRDRNDLQGPVRPEEQVRITLLDYVKWAEEDSGLDRKSIISLITVETQPKDVDAEVIKSMAKRKLARRAAQYREAFRVRHSIENSPGSRTSTQLSYPVPTLYGIIASGTLIALTAYNPEDDVPDLKLIGLFEMKLRDYDVWNAFALAIVVCHVRNVQMRIADDTGIGSMSPEESAMADLAMDDPDA